MILKAIFDLITGVINLIPFSLPDVPTNVQNVLDLIFNGITSSLGLINIFIDLRFWIDCTVAMTVVYNIKHVWNVIIWLLNLIPGVEISYWK